MPTLELDIQGANNYRIRAYRTAALTPIFEMAVGNNMRNEFCAKIKKARLKSLTY